MTKGNWSENGEEKWKKKLMRQKNILPSRWAIARMKMLHRSTPDIITTVVTHAHISDVIRQLNHSRLHLKYGRKTILFTDIRLMHVQLDFSRIRPTTLHMFNAKNRTLLKSAFAFFLKCKLIDATHSHFFLSKETLIWKVICCMSNT